MSPLQRLERLMDAVEQEIQAMGLSNDEGELAGLVLGYSLAEVYTLKRPREGLGSAPGHPGDAQTSPVRARLGWMGL